MPTYRRIEVKAFHRCVTIVSGEWPSADGIAPPLQTDRSVSLDDADACEPVEPASPKGQQILVEAVRSLERRLSPEARAAIRADHNTLGPQRPNRNGFYFKLHSFYQFICPKVLRFSGKEK